MALNWEISIGSPQIMAGMSFQVKYRKKTEQTWLPLLPNPTANIFVIPNLEENVEYEAEIRTVCTNGELSMPVYHSNGDNGVCVNPTLTSVRLNGSELLFTWTNNGWVYQPNYIELLVSKDNGVNWFRYGYKFAHVQSASYNIVDMNLVSGDNLLIKIRSKTDKCGEIDSTNTMQLTVGSVTGGSNAINPNYDKEVYRDCTNDISGGSCNGFAFFHFGQILNKSMGYVRFLTDGNNNDFSLYQSNSNAIVVNQNYPYNEGFSVDLQANCGNSNCIPIITNAVYEMQYSADGNVWENFIFTLK